MNLKQRINPGSEINQCPTCMEMFRSIFAFDAHRIGRFGVDRRCMSVAEMQQSGMAINPQNLWISIPMDSEAINKIRGSGIDC